VGETLIFYDPIEHEARNDRHAERVGLIFDLGTPWLRGDARELVKALTAAARAFGAARPA
jgi:hypothetical protein